VCHAPLEHTSLAQALMHVCHAPLENSSLTQALVHVRHAAMEHTILAQALVHVCHATLEHSSLAQALVHVCHATLEHTILTQALMHVTQVRTVYQDSIQPPLQPHVCHVQNHTLQQLSPMLLILPNSHWIAYNLSKCSTGSWVL